MGPNFILDKGFRVTTTTASKFRVCQLTDIEDSALATSGAQIPLGIYQEGPYEQQDVDDGRIGQVRILGISRAVAGAAIALNARLTVDGQGRVITAAPAAGVNVNVVGIALVDADQAGDHIDVLLTPGASFQGA
jgi:hypothetical protein